MFHAVDTPYTALSDKIKLKQYSTKIEKALSRKQYKTQLKSNRKQLAELQKKLYAHNKFSVLLVFQAMDAAGKDSTIASVLKGVNPAGCQVHSFKKPSTQELDHDFLWRTAKSLPERGRIGVFNRSYYEEVLAVKVHPSFLEHQQLPGNINNDAFWQARYESIANHEKHLAMNGTLVLKFFLNVSRQEQHQRFLSRLETPTKYWKFSAGDLRESTYWEQYMEAYETAIAKTSTTYAPWFIIPADNKLAMQATVSNIICQQLANLDMSYPTLSDAETAKFSDYKQQLIV